jgi:hypothetical protein
MQRTNGTSPYFRKSNLNSWLFPQFNSSILQWVAFFIPIYFQGVRNASPFKSGTNSLTFEAFLIPFALVAGVILSTTGVYRTLHAVGFALITIGLGLLTLQTRYTRTAVWVTFQAVEAIGQGFIVPTILPTIQASLPGLEVASSVGMYSFLRIFDFVWSITIPGIIFNAQWNKKHHVVGDLAIREEMRNGIAYHFTSATYRSMLPITIQDQIVGVYIESLRTIWQVAIMLALVGFVAVFTQRYIALRTELNTKFGLERRKDELTCEA